jgi:ABC-type transport system involved in multi-copper enzyme maturation permease subunit
LNKILPIVAITLKEGIRNRALQGILGIGSLLCLVYLAVMPMFSFERSKVMVDLVAASLSVAGLVIVLFLSISMLTKDIHQRSVCLILSRPISRTAYVIGKFCGLAFMVLIATLLIALIAFAASTIGAQFSSALEVPRNFSLSQVVLAYLLKYLGLLILLALAFLFTVVTTSEYLSMLLTAMIYLIGNSLETIVKVASAGSDVQLSGVYLNALKALTWILPNLSAFDLKVYVAYGLPIPPVQIAWTVAYGLLYTILVVTLVILVFNRKEIR